MQFHSSPLRFRPFQFGILNCVNPAGAVRLPKSSLLTDEEQDAQYRAVYDAARANADVSSGVNSVSFCVHALQGQPYQSTLACFSCNLVTTLNVSVPFDTAAVNVYFSCECCTI